MTVTALRPAQQEQHGLGGLYPQSWDEFIGQAEVKEQLITHAQSAKMREEPLDHTLIVSGVPGVGKTSLALLCAMEMGVHAKVVSGKISRGAARLTLAEMEDGDVLVIDEIHLMVSGGKANAEWLLHYLQDGVIVGPRGPEVQPRVTIIGCSTDVGKLPETIIDRFPIRPQIQSYSEDEAAMIAFVLSQKLLPTELPGPSSENCRQVARAASHNPRVMQQLWTAVRDVAVTSDVANYDKETRQYDVSKALSWLGLTEDGLTQTARRYLEALLVDFGGEPAGQTAMQDRLQEPGGLAYTERILMDKGLIVKTKSGRLLTQGGIRRARALRDPSQS